MERKYKGYPTLTTAITTALAAQKSNKECDWRSRVAAPLEMIVALLLYPSAALTWIVELREETLPNALHSLAYFQIACFDPQSAELLCIQRDLLLFV